MVTPLAVPEMLGAEQVTAGVDLAARPGPDAWRSFAVHHLLAGRRRKRLG